ncbi:hypothetical protein EGW08_014087 [Elysia chlorotica]|uniref:Uncharacterized protein n=1 Tax=Elysia chlorotica TaxID=188477 RepID=A0A433T9D6_ELYCH|nr:hypothetical protein EGW08_014087 [Elysia chlorotica]
MAAIQFVLLGTVIYLLAGDHVQGEGFYRFTNVANDSITGSCVPERRCGTVNTLWRDGALPAVHDGQLVKYIHHSETNNLYQYIHHSETNNLYQYIDHSETNNLYQYIHHSETNNLYQYIDHSETNNLYQYIDHSETNNLYQHIHHSETNNLYQYIDHSETNNHYQYIHHSETNNLYQYIHNDNTNHTCSNNKYSRNHDKDEAHRCVDQLTCHHEWFDESSDESKCQNYNSRDPRLQDLQCHFCCEGDACNTMIKPPTSSLYTLNAAP